MFWILYFLSAAITFHALKIDKHPFLTSLVKEGHRIKHRYFYPGHGGFIPKVEDTPFQKIGIYDLPELDELDNIHNPEVNSKKNAYHEVTLRTRHRYKNLKHFVPTHMELHDRGTSPMEGKDIRLYFKFFHQ
jgi:hypothetical protein